MNWGEAWILFGLIVINGLFAGSELALVSARKARLKTRAAKGHRGARVALQLLEDPTQLLSTVQIGITLVSVLTGLYSGQAFASDLAVVFAQYEWLGQYAEMTALTLVVIVVTYFSLILGELVPKRLALAHAETIAEFVAIPMTWILKFTWPLVWLLRVSTEAVTKLLPLRSAPAASITEDEVRQLVSEGAKEGVFERREKELIEGVLRLADSPIDAIMVRRDDILWLDSTMPLELQWREARGSGHSRFLLCDGALDQMQGVVTLADLGEALRLGGLVPAQHLRQPLHVPPTVSALMLLDMFRSANVHLAVVTGEYGEILGLVTPVDILRAIAGELSDLSSRERSEATRRDDGSWLFDGQIPIYEVERVLERNDLASLDNFKTLAGFVLWHLGRLPSPGESLIWRDLRIEVVDLDGPRIDKLLVSVRASTNGSESGQPPASQS
ncbi:MAG TPA: hemolysin family protein [Steroidobacteraceae bacterium]